MRQALDQIGAAIPFRAPGGVGPVAAAMKEQQFPAGDDKTLIERKAELVGAGRGVNRRPRHQIGVERPVVVVGDIGEMIVGKGRIELLAVAVDAIAHGAAKGLFRPLADPGLGVGCDVRRIDRAERRRHRDAAGKRLAAARRVTIAAIADRGENAAPSHQRRIERPRRRRSDGGDRRPPGHRECRADGGHQHAGDDACDHARRRGHRFGLPLPWSIGDSCLTQIRRDRSPRAADHRQLTAPTVSRWLRPCANCRSRRASTAFGRLNFRLKRDPILP